MSRKIATLWDKKPSEDDHEGQTFYAGGSEHSGQQILGPPSSNGRFVEDLITHARMSGTVAPNQDNALPITLYRNGFTVGQENEFRDYANNRAFLEYIKRGDVPPGLPQGVTEVKLINKAGQDYKPERNPFPGVGRRLGAPSPKTTDEQQ